MRSEALLDRVQRGAFHYLWSEVSSRTGLVRDRTGADIASVAGVGFQLSALPIGVERGWVTHEAAAARALQIIRALRSASDNRHEGLFFHFLEVDSALPVRDAAWCTVSTVDSAMLFAGLMTSASYFGGEIRTEADELVAAANWTAFQDPLAGDGHAGALSLGWVPTDPAADLTAGALLPYHWLDALCEQRLTVFLALCAPNPIHRPPPSLYTHLRRPLGRDRSGEPFVFNAFSGALFTHLLSHMWIDWASVGPDPAASLDWPARIPVDWWENSRRAVEMHRRRCAENRPGLPTLGPDSWGLSACDTPYGYRALGLSPVPLPMAGALVGRDLPPQAPSDTWGDGTISPHAAGAAIMFEPDAAVRALRHYRELSDVSGDPLVWSDPDDGGFGFFDAFNLAGPDGLPWASGDCIAIDQGMLLLGIENARSGLIWRLFHSHPFVRGAVERLGWSSGFEAKESLRFEGL